MVKYVDTCLTFISMHAVLWEQSKKYRPRSMHNCNAKLDLKEYSRITKARIAHENCMSCNYFNPQFVNT